MKVCIIGGNGNIGYYVARHLLLLGHKVVCFNRGLSGRIPEGAEIILGNRHDTEMFEQTMRRANFDAAVDMFCFNGDDALSSIRAFRGVGHFINCSSVATYGRDFDSFPTDETHALRPSTDHNRDYAIGKTEADRVFVEAFRSDGFPVTLIKPSITYGPRLGLIRQIGNDLAWIERIRRGKPIIVAGDGIALHQFMHADDAGRGIAMMVGKTNLIGESYNLVHDQPTSWDSYHKTAMRVIGRNVEMVGVPTATLKRLVSAGAIQISDIFWQNHFFSNMKLKLALPEFQPMVSLEVGLGMVYRALEQERRIPTSDLPAWEDQLIEAQKKDFNVVMPAKPFWRR